MSTSDEKPNEALEAALSAGRAAARAGQSTTDEATQIAALRTVMEAAKLADAAVAADKAKKSK